MDRRTTGIVLTILTVLLCGLPGLMGVCLGLLFAVISAIPGAQIDVFGRGDTRAAWGFGGGALCLGLLLILIPILVGIFALRRQPSVARGPAAPVAPPAPPRYSPPPVESPAPPYPPTSAESSAATIISAPGREPPTTGGAVVYTATEVTAPYPEGPVEPEESPEPEEPVDPEKSNKSEDAPDEWIPPAI